MMFANIGITIIKARTILTSLKVVIIRPDQVYKNAYPGVIFARTTKRANGNENSAINCNFEGSLSVNNSF